MGELVGADGVFGRSVVNLDALDTRGFNILSYSPPAYRLAELLARQTHSQLDVLEEPSHSQLEKSLHTPS